MCITRYSLILDGWYILATGSILVYHRAPKPAGKHSGDGAQSWGHTELPCIIADCGANGPVGVRLKESQLYPRLHNHPFGH